VPEVFSDFLSEPAFSISNATFCFWRLMTDENWKMGNIEYPRVNIDNVVHPRNQDPDGSLALLYMLDGNPATYTTWARNYYECDINLEVVKSIYRHEMLSDDLIMRLNAAAKIEALGADIDEIGYPQKN
jgi:hypothetical protein